jgi:hypothetical protein
MTARELLDRAEATREDLAVNRGGEDERGDEPDEARRARERRLDRVGRDLPMLYLAAAASALVELREVAIRVVNSRPR